MAVMDMARPAQGTAMRPFTLPSHRGEVRTRDFKQRRNLVLVFQHPDCPICDATLQALAERYPEYRDLDAEVIAVRPAEPAPELDERLPFPVAWDEHGDVFDAYAGRDMEGRPVPAVYVADRYGELAFASEGAHGPEIATDVLELLRFVAHSCPECNTPAWGWEEAA